MLFHCNNVWMKVPQCDVINTLPDLLLPTADKIMIIIILKAYIEVGTSHALPSNYEMICPEDMIV
jgi:hypothetical protein